MNNLRELYMAVPKETGACRRYRLPALFVDAVWAIHHKWRSEMSPASQTVVKGALRQILDEEIVLGYFATLSIALM